MSEFKTICHTITVDFKRAITALAPPDQAYVHEQAWQKLHPLVSALRIPDL